MPPAGTVCFSTGYHVAVIYYQKHINHDSEIQAS